MFTFAWMLATVAMCFLSAWLTVKNNSFGGVWFVLSCALSAFPIWAIISRYSTNIVFDSILFDVVLVLSYNAALFAITNYPVTLLQLAGLGLSSLGVILFKIGHT